MKIMKNPSDNDIERYLSPLGKFVLHVLIAIFAIFGILLFLIFNSD